MVGGTSLFADAVARLTDEVFATHPELDDHREQFPWLTGWLGDPSSPVWFVAENPSTTQINRINTVASTPEHQWAASRGDQLFRETLVELGLKIGTAESAGGWRCYITDVMKSQVFVKDWNGRKRYEQLRFAEAWAPVLRYELSAGDPQVLVVLGSNAERALNHLQRRELLPVLPRMCRVDHYSYVMHRPETRRRLGPGDPTRRIEWKQAVTAAARIENNQ